MRWAAWGALFLVVAALGVWVANERIPPWAERLVANRAGARGVEVAPEISVVGLTGAVVTRTELSGEGWSAEVGGTRLDWELPDVLQGRIASVEVDTFAAEVDLARFFPEPTPLAGGATPSVPGPVPGSATDELVPEALPPLGRGAVSPSPAPPMTTPEPLSSAASADGGPGDAPGGLGWWWEPVPVAAATVGEGRLGLRYGEASLSLLAGLEFSDGPDHRTLSVRMRGDGLLGYAAVESDPRDRTWTAQLSWQGVHPLEIAESLFPAGHPLNPDRTFARWLTRWRAGDLTVNALAEGQRRRLDRLSVMVEQGPLKAELRDGSSVLIRSLVGAVIRDQGVWRKAEAVLEIDQLAAMGGKTEPFFVDLGWSAEQPARIEIPGVRFESARVVAALAARGFLAPDGAAELQLAFSELSAGAVSLLPFRWFLNEREGTAKARLSELRSADWPDWQLGKTEFSIDRVPWRQTSSQPWQLRGSAELEYRPQMRSMARLEWSARPVAAGLYGWALEVAGEIGEPLAHLEGSASGEGAFYLRGSGDWALVDSLPYLFPFFPELKGTRTGGRLQWSVEAESDPTFGVKGRVRTTLADAQVHLRENDLQIEGVSGDLSWTVRGLFPASEGVQELRVARVAIGEEAVTDLTVRFRVLHRHALEVLSCEGKWMGGAIQLDPFKLDPFAPVIETTVRMQDVEARRLFPRSDATGFLIEAQLSGSVPFHYSPETGPELLRGLLSAVNPDKAVLRVTDPERMARFLPLPDALELKQKVLRGVQKDFRFRSIRIDVMDPSTPLQPLVLDFEGAVMNDEVEMRSIRVKTPQKFERPLKGWESLIFLFSGGTMGM